MASVAARPARSILAMNRSLPRRPPDIDQRRVQFHPGGASNVGATRTICSASTRSITDRPSFHAAV